MNRLLFSIITLAAEWARPRYNARMQLLEAQIRMLRSRVDASRIVPTSEERAELLRLGALVDHDIDDLMHIVLPESYKRWLREIRGSRPYRRCGRPRTPEATRRLVLRLVRENLLWGYRRVVGELKKLGIIIGATTIRDILREEGYIPDPLKGRQRPPIPWTTFVHANIESIVACDFFTKPVLTLFSNRRVHVLVFIHLGSRRDFCSPATYHPDGKWVMQQARNASMWMEEEGISPKFMIHDRDKKYPDDFDGFWKESNLRPIKTPPRAPMANAFCESFVGTLKRECLNHFFFFSRSQLDYIVRTWLDHYHKQRPHRGIGRDNTVLDVNFVPTSKGEVRCRKQLGGLIREYYRDAA